MAQTETSTSQSSSTSKLSAEAESFIPGQGHPGQNVGTQKAQEDPNAPLTSVPKYMLNCYPFVTGDPGSTTTTRPQGSPRFQNPGRSQSHNSGPRMPQPQGAYTFNGTRPPGPHNFQHPRNSKGHGLLHGPNVRPPGPPQFGALPGTSHSLPYRGTLPHTGINNFYQYPGMPPQGWSGQGGPYPPGLDPQFGMPPYMSTQTDQLDWSGAEKVKSGKSKKKKEASNMVSIGIQNESGVLSGPVPKKKTKTKTIILMDAAIQTDFSDEIADKTLAEVPNSLFKGSNWHLENSSSTESEEVDSDSGYSSPLHRRNQASNGTHPVVAGMTYVPPGLVTKDNTGLVHKQGSTFTFMPNHVTNHVTIGPGYTYPGVQLPRYASPYLPSYPPPTPQATSLPRGVGNTSSNIERNTETNSGNLSSGNAKIQIGEEEAGAAGKKKKRRNRRRKKNKTQNTEDSGALSDEPMELHHAQSSSNVSRTSTDGISVDADNGLHFEDEEEFPDLGSDFPDLACAHKTLQNRSPITKSPVVVSYSDILKSPATQTPRLTQDNLEINVYSGNTSDSRRSSVGSVKETKNARKRRKRREIANKAAEEELAEISLEQQFIRELSAKQIPQKPSTPPPPPPPQPQSSGKKSKQPISLNLSDMISALEKQQEKQKDQEKDKTTIVTTKTQEAIYVGNPLDASAPAIKRGKEREVPKAKKPSSLKKVIIKEREERKRLKLLDDYQNPISPTSSTTSSQIPSIASVPLDSDLSQDAGSSKASSMDYGTGTPVSADMSPISQTSPISMSPLSPGGSPLSSGVNSPIASNMTLGEPRPSVALKIHSRRFREYCTQILDKEIDNSCTLLLQDLVKFQDRLYHKDPVKAKAKRRIVLGLREVTKHLKLKKIKCVIISPNLERIQSKGGLDDALNNIIDMCHDQQVPFVFALGRRALGRACAKLVPVSVVGVFNYEGSEENFNNLMSLTEKARQDYHEMIDSLAKEMNDNPNKASNTFPHLFAHMGHSRTPSACSAISFTSSILSEPISENYPHSEPETDSRGYEIVKEAPKVENLKIETELANISHSIEPDETMSPLSSSGGKVGALGEIDEGHEADTEDYNESNPSRKRWNSGKDSVKEINFKETGSTTSSNASSKGTFSTMEVKEDDTVNDLPHIDSIHSSAVDLNAEILSTHSSKTLDLNTDVLSTHSSKTLGETGTSTPKITSDSPIPTESRDSNPGSGSLRQKTIDKKERIESWVADTQQQMSKLSVNNHDNEQEPFVSNCINHNEEVNNCSKMDKHMQEDNLNENGQTNCCSVCDAQNSAAS